MLPPTSLPVNPPPQLSLNTFRTYEPFIKQAIENWPDETQWLPEKMVNPISGRPLAPTTFAARMRDAVVSYQRFVWDSTINREKFVEIYGKFAIAADKDGSVWFRNRARRGRPLTFTAEAKALEAGAVVTQSPTWDTCTIDELRALCTLLNSAKLVGPIVIRTRFPDDVVASLSELNVAIHYDETLKQTIVA